MNILVDGDSMCYSAGNCATEADVKLYLDNKIRLIIASCKSNKLVGWVERTERKCNFRRHVATTLVYKGNRTSDKPPYLNYAKEYMVKQYGFRWANWIESEDYVCIAAKQLGYSNCIVACIDKDLLQIPCTFFNYERVWKQNKQRFLKLSEDEAEYNLYTQFLTGDKSTDNIEGIYGVGPGKAAKVLACDRSRWPREVALVYIAHGLPYQYMLEQARLVYLIREMNEVYMYPLTKAEYEQLEQEASDGDT